MSRELERLKVENIMNTKVYTTTKDNNVQEVAILMEANKVSSIIVMENKHPIGIITERDIIHRVVTKNVIPSQIKCEEVMTTPLITCFPDLELVKGIERMTANNIKRLVVKSDDNILIGVISMTDILRIAPDLMEIAYDAIKRIKSIQENNSSQVDLFSEEESYELEDYEE